MNQLDQYEKEDGPVIDALIFADMTIDSAGQKVEFGERMSEILRRYSPADPVARVINSRSRAVLRAAVERTNRRVWGATN